MTHWKKIGLLLEVALSFSWILPLWLLGWVVGLSYLLESLGHGFSGTGFELMGTLGFMLWLCAGGLGLLGILRLLYFIMTRHPRTNPAPMPSRKTYTAVCCGLLAALPLSGFYIVDFAERIADHRPAGYSLVVSLYALLPLLCSLHLWWLSHRKTQRLMQWGHSPGVSA